MITLVTVCLSTAYLGWSMVQDTTIAQNTSTPIRPHHWPTRCRTKSCVVDAEVYAAAMEEAREVVTHSGNVMEWAVETMVEMYARSLMERNFLRGGEELAQQFNALCGTAQMVRRERSMLDLLTVLLDKEGLEYTDVDRRDLMTELGMTESAIYAAVRDLDHPLGKRVRVNRTEDNPIVVMGSMDPWASGEGIVLDPARCSVPCKYKVEPDFGTAMGSLNRAFEEGGEDAVHVALVPWVFGENLYHRHTVEGMARKHNIKTAFFTGEATFDPWLLAGVDLFGSPRDPPMSDMQYLYHPGSDWFSTGCDPDAPVRYSVMDHPLPSPEGRIPGAVVVISNCYPAASWRSNYVLELARHMPVTFAGNCFRSELSPEVAAAIGKPGDQGKRETANMFRFLISLENNMVNGYLTEKFFDPLTYDTVVAYLGPPNAAEFFPGPNSFVDISQFPDPADLATFLTSMTDQEWVDRFQWRKQESVDQGLANRVKSRCLDFAAAVACSTCEQYHLQYDFK